MKKSSALDNEFYFGATAATLQFASDLRKNMTTAEQHLWSHLRGKKLGVKFRRQHPISRFIADFYCHEKRLVIEADGEIHDIESHQDYDMGRDEEMSVFGIRVLRFTNKEILENIDDVICEILKQIREI